MRDLKIFTNNIEPQALNQIYELLDQEPFKDCKVRIMPDVHAGAGCVIGFTGNLGDKVIPNIVGVDIGCGMLTVELGKIDINLESLDNFIKTNIPSGRNVYDKDTLSNVVSDFGLEDFKCYKYFVNTNRLLGSLGTLGGGNHFIEIDVDNDGNKYLIIHTGSRNLGKQVAEIYQNLAIKKCKTASQEEREQLIKDLKAQNRQKDIPEALKSLTDKYANKTKLPNDLCYLEGEDRDNYLHDMRLCQLFAIENRFAITTKIIKFLEVLPAYSFSTIHNYIDDNNVIRKGAISAYKGEEVLIPINMRDGCIVGIGKGNPDWNESAPHGAGRIMSRSQAKKELNLEDFQETMQGIYTTTAVADTLDESPMVYKPMEEIIKNIKDTVEIVKIIKPIYNFKASE